MYVRSWADATESVKPSGGRWPISPRRPTSLAPWSASTCPMSYGRQLSTWYVSHTPSVSTSTERVVKHHLTRSKTTGTKGGTGGHAGSQFSHIGPRGPRPPMVPQSRPLTPPSNVRACAAAGAADIDTDRRPRHAPVAQMVERPRRSQAGRGACRVETCRGHATSTAHEGEPQW